MRGVLFFALLYSFFNVIPAKATVDPRAAAAAPAADDTEQTQEKKWAKASLPPEFESLDNAGDVQTMDATSIQNQDPLRPNSKSPDNPSKPNAHSPAALATHVD